MKPPLFISAGIGQWFSSGVERLGGTLRDKGWPGDVKLWKDDWPDAGFSRDPIYNVKAAAFQWAVNNYYTTIVWGDASITAVRPMKGFLEHINTHGRWLGQSGYNCAEVCGDAMLEYFAADRDWAAGIHDCATGLFGVNINNPESRVFIETWIKAGRDGAFSGSRHHAGQSKDPRFKFGRQDQACASLIAGKLGWKLDEWQSMVAFKWDSKDGKVFACEGM